MPRAGGRLSSLVIGFVIDRDAYPGVLSHPPIDPFFLGRDAVPQLCELG